MIKIALIGYGKMGKSIEKALLQNPNFEIALVVNSKNATLFSEELLHQHRIQIAVECSTPHTVLQNIHTCLRAQVPVLVGATGWYDALNTVLQWQQQYNGLVVYASNFSVGVNVFFAINTLLAKLLQPYAQYQPRICEIHHTQKLDAPSGTAITLANSILQNFKHPKSWVNNATTNPHTLSIISKRLENETGTHIVTYESPTDTLEIKHTAHNREGFAQGALLALLWIYEQHTQHAKKGVFSIQQIFESIIE